MATENKSENGQTDNEAAAPAVRASPAKIFEETTRDVPERLKPQVPDVNPSVQKGHRDREQI